MKPNIILINCDDLGYGDLSCYGSKKHSTPALDKLAKEGVRFTDFYVGSPVCSPSRGSLMTGCFPPRIGFGSFEGRWVLFPGQKVGLSTKETTIASALKTADYSTMIVGKWHCGDQKEFLPTRHGFDHYYGIPFSNDMGRQANNDFQYPPLPLLLDEEVLQEQPDQIALTERYLEQSTRFIRDNKEKPFFLYLAHMYVHLPIYAPHYFVEKSKNGRYGAGVEYVDYVTSAIVAELEKQGIRENTIIIFTSDNGSRDDNGESNKPLRGKKGTTWEGGQRVPFILNWKGTIQGGRESDEIVGSVDLLPTLARIAGADYENNNKIDGLDLSDLFLGKTDKSARDMMVYYRLNNLEAVRIGDYKLHFRKADEEINELYNLKEDISETKNLFDLMPEKVKEIQDIADEIRCDLGDEATGIVGQNVRPSGMVDIGVPLTTYDETYPYIISEYDLSDRG